MHQENLLQLGRSYRNEDHSEYFETKCRVIQAHGSRKNEQYREVRSMVHKHIVTNDIN